MDYLYSMKNPVFYEIGFFFLPDKAIAFTIEYMHNNYKTKAFMQ